MTIFIKEIKIATVFFTMKNYIIIAFFFVITFSDCTVVSQFQRGKIERELIDLNTFKINEVAQTATYGYTSQQPIKVGGVESNEGILNSRRFLNALRGPKGEKVTYELKGSCCYHQLPEGSSSKVGLLDKYEINVDGLKYMIFLSTFEEAELFAPKGFSFVSN